MNASITQALRDYIFERDSYTCVVCTGAASDIHHVVARSLGGRNHPHNLVAVCRPHHCQLHGERIRGSVYTTFEVRQAVHEYLQDLYAEDIEAGVWAGG
ncbi:MAG: HNH endonuclease [Oscillospiraceae bacterium]|nr:HNH endonuclease [Oscillospiraceae bacterium]